MATDAIASAAPASSIGIQDFLRILTSELSNQDPLKPLDNQEFIAQIAQFTALDQTRQLNGKIDQLLSMQSAGQSIGLLGKAVDIQTTTGAVAGTVTAIDMASGTPSLTVRDAAGAFVTGVTLSQVKTIR
jgi:flagellar basal-body rod modification protein FlgD